VFFRGGHDWTWQRREMRGERGRGEGERGESVMDRTMQVLPAQTQRKTTTDGDDRESSGRHC
jgi:hypothetical protein